MKRLVLVVGTPCHADTLAAAGFTFGAAVTVGAVLLVDAVLRVARRVIDEAQR